MSFSFIIRFQCFNKFIIKFNLVIKEAEIEGSEEFVKTYFEKLQALMSGSSTQRAKKSKAIEPASAQKVSQPAEKELGKKRVTNISEALQLIQASKAGISTAEIKEKTGLTERQIWSIVNNAKRAGKIKKVKRGLYAAI